MSRIRAISSLFTFIVTPFFLTSCVGGSSTPDHEVIVYTALDREFSEPVLSDFEKQEKIGARAKYDVESTKTVGLVNTIIEEKNHPRCDVFWNNEILHTLRLEKMGLLDAYDLPQAEKFPKNYRSAEGRWYGFAARARVLIVNTKIVAESERPTSIHDLADPKWKGKAAIAKPLFGTTATHAAVLFSHWGDEEAKEFFHKLKTNVQVLSGNKQVAQAVAGGQAAFGLTDTDDAIIEIDGAMPVAIVYPDQGEDSLGALFIPNTLCIMKGAPNPNAARQLLDYLLTADVEFRLAEGASAQFPLHEDMKTVPRVGRDGVRWMDVDFEAAADAWEDAAKFLEKEFASAD